MPALVQWLRAWCKLANACPRHLAGRAHPGHNMSMANGEICKAALEVVVMVVWTLAAASQWPISAPSKPHSPSPLTHC